MDVFTTLLVAKPLTAGATCAAPRNRELDADTFTDRNALHWRDLYNYGAIFDTAAAALNRVSPMGIYETRHLLNALVGILVLAGCDKLGHAVGGARVGFLATLFLFLTPNYYGQMFNNPKDIPFAVG